MKLTHDYLEKLLPMTRHENGEPLVNARDLWKCLQVQTPFNKWVARRLKELEAVENKDFWTNLSESQGGRPSKEYQIHLVTAKEMAMLERTPIGRQVRRYFITIEEQWRAQQITRKPLTIMEALKQTAQVLDEQHQRLVLLESEQEKLKNHLRNTPLRSDGVKRAKVQELIRSYAMQLGGKPVHYQRAYNRYKAYFGVNIFDDVPVRLYQEALEVLEKWIELDFLD